MASARPSAISASRAIRMRSPRAPSRGRAIGSSVRAETEGGRARERVRPIASTAASAVPLAVVYFAVSMERMRGSLCAMRRVLTIFLWEKVQDKSDRLMVFFDPQGVVSAFGYGQGRYELEPF